LKRLKGWGLGSGSALPVGVWGLAPPQKKKSAKNYAILSKFWYFIAILQQKVGELSPQSWKWGTYPPAPPLLRCLCSGAQTSDYSGQDARSTTTCCFDHWGW